MSAHVNHPNLAPLVKRVSEATDPAAALESTIALIANRPLRTWTDTEVERIPMLAQSFGQLFQAERNGYLPGLTLTKEEKQRSERSTQKNLQQQLDQYQEDPVFCKPLYRN